MLFLSDPLQLTLRRGTLAAESEALDEVAKKFQGFVAPQCWRARQERDLYAGGQGADGELARASSRERFHITVLSADELSELEKAGKSFADVLAVWLDETIYADFLSVGGEPSGDDPRAAAGGDRATGNVGESGLFIPGLAEIGGCKHDENRPPSLSFLPVVWPKAQIFRSLLDLEPKDLHVTVGFLRKDKHNIRKDVSSLRIGWVADAGVRAALSLAVGRCVPEDIQDGLLCAVERALEMRGGAGVERALEMRWAGGGGNDSSSRSEAGASSISSPEVCLGDNLSSDIVDSLQFLYHMARARIFGRRKLFGVVLSSAEQALEFRPLDTQAIGFRLFALFQLGNLEDCERYLAESACWGEEDENLAKIKTLVQKKLAKQASGRGSSSSSGVTLSVVGDSCPSENTETTGAGEKEIASSGTASKGGPAVTNFAPCFDGVVREKMTKYPRTPHLRNLGAATDDDIVQEGMDTQFVNRGSVYVEEKIDGANIG